MLSLEFDQPWGAIRIPQEMMDTFIRMKEQGARVHVAITPIVQGRSMSQNSLFHALLHDLSEETGYTLDELKDMVKEFAVGIGYPSVERNGKRMPISTSSVSVEHMETLIEATYMWADKNEIYLRRR